MDLVSRFFAIDLRGSPIGQCVEHLFRTYDSIREILIYPIELTISEETLFKINAKSMIYFNHQFFRSQILKNINRFPQSVAANPARAVAIGPRSVVLPPLSHG